jgi:hypothetical protein
VNGDVGSLTIAAVVVTLAIVPVVILEWIVLWKRLRLRLGRALWVSLLANLASTLLGSLIGMGIERVFVPTGIPGLIGPIGLMGALAIFFVITYPIELGVVRGMVAAPVPDVAHATLWANAFSYVVLEAFVLSLFLIAPWP